MNERIKELIIETLGREGVVASRAFGHWALSDEQLDKFDELIVRECIDTVSDCSVEYCTRPQIVSEIKEHFGVSE